MTPNDADFHPAAPLPEIQPEAETRTLPIIEEVAHIQKEVVETGRVVIRKTVHHDTQTVDVPLQEEQVHVERVPINQVVETPPEVRYDGDTMIIPVLREEVVVTTRLVLVEELRVRKRTLTLSHPQEVSLRREEVHYERIEEPPTPPAAV
ncbi:YsnF/AvaK domain-containing protein [Hymenobacter terrenus]|uniref:YsnF/AvaK domain-containing protein n=1 Tax=Hymenobacter terrenus TaxID=1629124 RepID=UPI0009E3F299|nr:YsnF/AvaK domain-containing protein [Hymenobacter terrenus]